MSAEIKRLGGSLSDAAQRPRNTSRPVLLVGHLDEENLGLGYLSATLRQFGYRVSVIDSEGDPGALLRSIRAEQPLIVGFSLMFQFHLLRFARLVRELRNAGIDSHFTIGGHFPSLSYQATLETIPELDSVVRFEGEETLLELADTLSMGGAWRGIPGLVWQENGEIVSSPLRPLLSDLDALPYPDRSKIKRAFVGRRSTHILASRGCIRTCSFCSIHMFYRSAPGKVVRTRNPVRVVDEIEALYTQDAIRLFMFQDDDFPVYGVRWREWTHAFCNALEQRGLSREILWKISCRADAVQEDLFARMRDCGLFLVYMGLESGNEEGLNSLNKRITVDQNIRAVETLKRLGIGFAFGFMLFEPASTFATVRQDLAFLRKIAGDGSVAATFCRMVPYDGTPIKDELIRQGRFRGDVCNPDYDFCDPKLGEFCHALGHFLDVTGWVHGLESVSYTLNSAWSELAVMQRLFARLPGIEAYRLRLQDLTRESNALLLRVVEDISYVYSDGAPETWSAEVLREQCRQFNERFLRTRNAFVARNQDRLLAALQTSPSVEPLAVAD